MAKNTAAKEKKSRNAEKKYPKPPFPKQEQEVPGHEKDMKPLADHGEKSYQVQAS